MTRFGLRCTCKSFLPASSMLREQPEMNALNYLLDQHKAHRAAASEQGLLLESKEDA